MKFADLHLHTLYSDGTYTPQRLISESQRCNLSAIAVCDHDTVDGVEPVIEAAKQKHIEVIAGIELTTEYEGTEVHILGYLIDYRNKELIEKLQNLKNNRIQRLYKMIDRLKNLMDVNLNPDAVFEIAGEGTVGRLHIARALVKQGWVGSIFEAFQKYIGDKSPCYVAGFRFSPAEAMKLIRAIGGIPALAHPHSLNRDGLIPELINLGLMAIEAYYPEYSQSLTNFYLELASKNDLLVTGGSDCHGEAKPEIKIGSIKIPYELVEKLKQAKRKL